MDESLWGARARLLVVLAVLLAALGLSAAGPARADQADSAAGRVAAASIAAGQDDTCALLLTGAVRCWGYGGFGELGYDSPANVGDGSGSSIQTSADVPLGSKATAIAAGTYHTCALLTIGAVRCWGNGISGQLGHDSTAGVGDGTGPSIKDAGDIPLGGKATAITAGAYHTCALLTTGAVRCWGSGGDGQLGHNATSNIGDGGVDPSIKDAGDIPLGGRATAITAGAYHTCALLTTGTVRCWGSGFFGQLGHNNTNDVGDGTRSIKDAGDVPVGGRATAITAGAYHTCALLTTGVARCWGYGGDGELGHNDTSNIGDGVGLSIISAGDVPVGGRVSAITGGADHTCALLTTGALRCWGNGLLGQLGHDSTYSVGDGGGGNSINAAGDIPVGGRVRVRAATGLSAIIAPTRDRHAPYVYRVTGRVHGLFVADSATCNGQVTVSTYHGHRLLQRRTTQLHADCHYRVRTKITATRLHTHRTTKLTLKVHYLGTHNLTPAATTRHVRAN